MERRKKGRKGIRRKVGGKKGRREARKKRGKAILNERKKSKVTVTSTSINLINIAVPCLSKLSILCGA